MLKCGIITKVNSNTFTIKSEGKYYDMKARGKNRFLKVKPVVGDNVKVDTEKLVIESVLDRKNILNRPPVANVDIALIITSLKKPNLSLSLLDKLISIIAINNIEPVIVFTKLDLVEDLKEYDVISKYYKKIGIEVFNNNDISKLKKYLKNKIVTVCGQTGAGKSSLINKLDKNLNLETKEISEALGRGVHTTRLTTLYEIDNYYIVDTPGFSALDIDKYSKEEIKNSFKEFKHYKCKFKDCNHINEPGCMVKDAVSKNKILESRYKNYLEFVGEAR